MSDSFEIDWDGDKDSPILPGEEVYLDVNVLAENKSYCSIGAALLSPSQNFLAYSVDYKGDETYEVHIRDLETGKEYPLSTVGDDKLLETSGTVLWGKDESTLFYMTMDSTHRPYRLYSRQNWRSDAPVDTLLKEEPDDVYWAHAHKSLDGQYLFFETASSETSEVWFMKLDDEVTELRCIAPRRSKVLYEVEHGHGDWWIWTNVDNSPNMKLMKARANAECASEWELVLDSDGKPVFDGNIDLALDSVTTLQNHVVVQGRYGGIPRVWIYDLATKKTERLEFDEAAHDVGMASQLEFDTATIAVGYDSLVTPPQTIQISLSSPSENRKILKAKTVPGYDKETYGCDRLTVKSRDGKTDIPISVVYRKDVMEKVKAGGRAPTHLYGYGSYGMCCEADFSSTRLPLLERGMIYVIAHIRGGGEMGRAWYEEPNGAKYLCKKNTFFDFCDVAKFLVENWTSPEMLSCEGRSAGGMLIGASINLEPELFRVAILGVPFLDVVATMVDASIPLTAGEWVEWGNPNEEKFFQYMMDYSPMQNIKSNVQYPACFLTGGLFDPRVQYWYVSIGLVGT
jgi:oligopeptidase B